MSKPDWVDIDIPTQYRTKPKLKEPKPILGFDTETENGKAFLISCSDGSYSFPSSSYDLLSFLTQHRFRKTINLFWNIDYDFFAIVKGLPKEQKEDLAHIFKTVYDNYTITWLPNKSFSISYINHTTQFYDLWQFFRSSLDYASKKFLGKNKLEIDVTKFDNPRYRKKYMKEIIEYCIKDAQLTAELGEYFQKMCLRIGVDFNTPISPAYLSQRYFSSITRIPTIKPTTPHHYAYNSYHGGRFEVFKRGYFDIVHYADLNSAYPAEISRLYDINRGYWVKDKKVHEDATYGFMHVIATTFSSSVQPLPYDNNGLIIYPEMHQVEDWITLQEYKMFTDLNVAEFDVIDGVYWFPHELIRPFESIEGLYRQRLKLKEENNPLEYVVKIIMNSLYGKFFQKVPVWIKSDKPIGAKPPYICANPKYFGTYYKIWRAGSLFNPVYASIITSEVRRKIYKSLYKQENSIIATFTDCLITTKPVMGNSREMGEWSSRGKYEAVILGNGVYTLRNDNHVMTRFRGFKNIKGFDLFEILEDNAGKKVITIPQKHVIKLKEALMHTTQLSPDSLNKFIELNKDLDINFDKKRLWDRQFEDAQDCLSDQITSLPLAVAF